LLIIFTTEILIGKEEYPGANPRQRAVPDDQFLSNLIFWKVMP